MLFSFSLLCELYFTFDACAVAGVSTSLGAAPCVLSCLVVPLLKLAVVQSPPWWVWGSILDVCQDLLEISSCLVLDDVLGCNCDTWVADGSCGFGCNVRLLVLW